MASLSKIAMQWLHLSVFVCLRVCLFDGVSEKYRGFHFIECARKLICDQVGYLKYIYKGGVWSQFAIFQIFTHL